MVQSTAGYSSFNLNSYKGLGTLMPFPASPTEEVSLPSELFKEGTRVTDAIRAINKIAKERFQPAANELRSIKRLLVAHIVIAYAEANRPGSETSAKTIVERWKNDNLDRKTKAMKHGDFGVFVRVCLCDNDKGYDREDYAAISQMADDAYVVFTHYEDKDALAFGYENQLADVIHSKGYSYYHKLESKAKASKARASSKVGELPKIDLGGVSAVPRDQQQDLKGLLSESSGVNDMFLLTAGGILRASRGAKGLEVVKGVTCNGELFAAISKLFGEVG